MGMYKFTDGESDMFKGDLPVFASDNEVSVCVQAFLMIQMFLIALNT